MTARSAITVTLTLRGDCVSPEFARAQLGADPNVVRMPPGHGEHSRRYCKVPWCSFDSGLARDVELEKHVAALLDRFHGHAERLRSLTTDRGVEVMIDAVVESYDGDTPPLFLAPDLVRRMADLGASFWIDLYLREDRPPEKRYRIEVDRG